MVCWQLRGRGKEARNFMRADVNAFEAHMVLLCAIDE